MKFTSKDSPEEILEQFVNGNEAALAYYHKKHFASLFNFAVGIVKQDDVAKDIVSNCFFKLWKNRVKIEKPTNLTSYLYTSAKNECFTHLDKQKREIKHVERFKYICDTFEFIKIKDYNLKKKLMELISMEINSLPKRCREIVEFSFLKGLNNQQIAKEMKISVNTIKNQKSKGLKILRSKLKGYNNTDALMKLKIPNFSDGFEQLTTIRQRLATARGNNSQL